MKTNREMHSNSRTLTHACPCSYRRLSASEKNEEIVSNDSLSHKQRLFSICDDFALFKVSCSIDLEEISRERKTYGRYIYDCPYV